MRTKCSIKYLELNGESNHDTPNGVVEWLTLLLRFREVPSSNLLMEVVCGFPQSLQICWDSTSN
jgi:hypothetical protein